MQRRVLVPVLPGSKRQAFFHGPRLAFLHPLRPLLEMDAVPLAIVGELLVADEAIRPEVRDFNLQFVVARLGGLGDVDSERGLPQDAQVLAVQPNLGNLLDAAEVEQDRTVFAESLGGDVDGFAVRRRAGEILDAGVLMFGPKAQPFSQPWASPRGTWE